MGRLKRVRKIFRTRPKPLRALNRWGRRPKGPRGKLKRFRTLRKWARKKMNAAKGAGRKAWERRRRRFNRKVRFLKKRIDTGEHPTTGVGTFDGKPVPNWMIPPLLRARATGLWAGIVISGVRSPEYSEQLCYDICGAPMCPGRCAGRASNHNVEEPVEDGEGAIDVTDHVGLERALAKNGDSHLLKNEIGPSDPNHFSRSGR